MGFSYLGPHDSKSKGSEGMPNENNQERLTINRDKVDFLLHGVVWLGGGGDLGLTVGGVHQLPPDLHLVGELGLQERDQSALPLVSRYIQ